MQKEIQSKEKLEQEMKKKEQDVLQTQKWKIDQLELELSSQKCSLTNSCFYFLYLGWSICHFGIWDVSLWTFSWSIETFEMQSFRPCDLLTKYIFLQETEKTVPSFAIF